MTEYKKLSDAQKTEVRAHLKAGKTIQAIAERYGCHPSAVGAINRWMKAPAGNGEPKAKAAKVRGKPGPKPSAVTSIAAAIKELEAENKRLTKTLARIKEPV
jgi:transposase-like protein